MKFHHYSKCVWLFAGCLLAQQEPRRSSVQGEVHGNIPSDAQVELRPCTGGGQPLPMSSVRSSGSFELRDVEPGCYHVSVVSGAAKQHLYDSIHDVNGHGALQLRLKEFKQERPASTGVTVAALRPKPSKKAMRLLEDAAKLSAKQDYAGAADKLRMAIEKDPAFAEAHINLGAQLARLRQPEAALAEFEQARLLGIHTAPLMTNIAALLLDLRRWEEAESSLRSALQDDAEYPQAHFIMGQLLIRAKQKPALAAAHFRKAVAIPSARIMLGQTLAHMGQRAEAVAELNAYLSSGHNVYRAAVENILANLAASTH